MTQKRCERNERETFINTMLVPGTDGRRNAMGRGHCAGGGGLEYSCNQCLE